MTFFGNCKIVFVAERSLKFWETFNMETALKKIVKGKTLVEALLKKYFFVGKLKFLNNA